MLKKLMFSAALWVGLTGAALADDHPVVVELFTSQGCSSCPPADAVLAELGQMDDVIPLALHVDYWDYIGWKDNFASPQFTKRQKGYARAEGWRIYTPQMVVGGTDDVVGSRSMKVADLVRKHAARPKVADVDLSRQGGSLVIRVKAIRATGRPCEVHVVRYEPSQTVPIAAGENAGRRVTYTNIVRDWRVVGVWDGRSDFETRMPISGNAPVVVLLQEPRYGPILAAARLR